MNCILADKIALERPNAVAGIISQNGNAYVEGFEKDFWAPAFKVWKDDTKENRATLTFTPGFESTKFQVRRFRLSSGLAFSANLILTLARSVRAWSSRSQETRA
jgi:hypothetical protein